MSRHGAAARPSQPSVLRAQNAPQVSRNVRNAAVLHSSAEMSSRTHPTSARGEQSLSRQLPGEDVSRGVYPARHNHDRHGNFVRGGDEAAHQREIYSRARFADKASEGAAAPAGRPATASAFHAPRSSTSLPQYPVEGFGRPVTSHGTRAASRGGPGVIGLGGGAAGALPVGHGWDQGLPARGPPAAAAYSDRPSGPSRGGPATGLGSRATGLYGLEDTRSRGPGAGAAAGPAWGAPPPDYDEEGSEEEGKSVENGGSEGSVGYRPGGIHLEDAVEGSGCGPDRLADWGDLHAQLAQGEQHREEQGGKEEEEYEGQGQWEEEEDEES